MVHKQMQYILRNIEKCIMGSLGRVSSDVICTGSSRGHSMNASAHPPSYEHRESRRPPPPRRRSSHEYEEGAPAPPSKRARGMPPQRHGSPSFGYAKMRGGGDGGYPPSRH